MCSCSLESTYFADRCLLTTRVEEPNRTLRFEPRVGHVCGVYQPKRGREVYHKRAPVPVEFTGFINNGGTCCCYCCVLCKWDGSDRSVTGNATNTGKRDSCTRNVFQTCATTAAAAAAATSATVVRLHSPYAICCYSSLAPHESARDALHKVGHMLAGTAIAPHGGPTTDPKRTRNCVRQSQPCAKNVPEFDRGQLRETTVFPGEHSATRTRNPSGRSRPCLALSSVVLATLP